MTLNAVKHAGAQHFPQPYSGAGREATVQSFAILGTTPTSVTLREAIARRFLARFSDLEHWQAAELGVRAQLPVDVRGFVSWWVIDARFPVDSSYVVAIKSWWGVLTARAYPTAHAQFTDRARVLGFSPTQIRQQWHVLSVFTAISGLRPLEFTPTSFQDTKHAWFTAIQAHRPDGRLPNNVTTPTYGLTSTLTTLDVLTAAQVKNPTQSLQPVRWRGLQAQAPVLVDTMAAYLAQIALSLRPGTVSIADTSLRHLATYLTDHHPEVTGVADIKRTHIEGFKAWLTARTGYRGRTSSSATTIGMRLGNVRTFFDRIIEWDWADAPARNPVLFGDAPIPDRPLPKFLDDADAAALMAAARQLPDLFDRVCVETLARTGMRKGEFRRLTLDAIVHIGDGFWLRTPVGKLHTDRYIPLHPNVKTLLEQWISARGDQPHTNLMFTQHGRPLPQTRIDTAVHRAATAAGIGHITPHQLRHTLATQAINRGMSLEAIAALLGHNSMSMTLTYAKIADRTVANEYFNVTEQIEALYDTRNLPAETEGPNMRALRTEVTTRLLGNGYCTRPTDLGCRYETICQSCTFFATGIEFRDTLTTQRNEAKKQGDQQKENLYSNLIEGIKNPNS